MRRINPALRDRSIGSQNLDDVAGGIFNIDVSRAVAMRFEHPELFRVGSFESDTSAIQAVAMQQHNDTGFNAAGTVGSKEEDAIGLCTSTVSIVNT